MRTIRALFLAAGLTSAACGATDRPTNEAENTAAPTATASETATVVSTSDPAPGAGSASASASAAPPPVPASERPVDLAKVTIKGPKIKLTKTSLDGKCDEAFPIRKNDEGKVYGCNTPKELKVGPYTCKKEQFIQLQEKDLTFIGCDFVEPVKFDTLQCKAAYFHQNGQMNDCILATPIPGACTQKVVFDDKGAPTHCFGE